MAYGTRCTVVALALFVVLAVPARPARADEPLFGYVYLTDLLPKGRWDTEQWITDRQGQAFGRFHDLQLRNEVEYGLTDNFQLAGYVNYSYENASRNSVRHLTEGTDIPWDHDPTRPYSEWRFDGISVEGIYRLLSPYKDPFGLALYLEPEVGPRETEVEARLILQKNFLDDRLVFGANVWIAFANEQGSNLVTPGSDQVPDGAIHKATYFELDLGASYRFVRNWSAGLEFRNHNEYQGFSIAPDDQDHTAFFLGPTIHYGGERWWFTLTALRQLGAVGFTPDQRAQIRHGRIYGDEHTQWDGIRLKIGFNF